MGEEKGREIGEALVAHEGHEVYDPAEPGALAAMELRLGVRLPASYRGLLLVGSGGILENGDLLLGTLDPEELGATLLEMAPALWEEGLDRTLLPFLDGERLLCLDLGAVDEAGDAEVVEVDPDDLQVVRRHGPFTAFFSHYL